MNTMYGGMMSDRGFLFLFSLLMAAAGLGTAGWLLATGQAGTVDGLFLLLAALLAAAIFAAYLVFLIRRAMESSALGPVKAEAASAPKESAVPAAQRRG